jgi:hypothetical protein
VRPRAFLGAATLLVAAVACSNPRPSSGAREAGAAAIDVPRATAVIVPTGHFRVELWGGAPSTRTLLDHDGKGAVPVSEARLLWGDGSLYVFFYAGDLDLEARVKDHDGPVWNDDSVELAFGGPAGDRRVVRASVTGVVTDGVCPGDAASLADPRCNLGWESRSAVATDFDGTLNDTSGERDEEWAVEAAIPLASLSPEPLAAGARIPLRISRCEIAHDGPRACGAWEGTLVLSGAELRVAR